MTASNLALTQASVATHHSRSEQFGTAGDTKPIIAQVVIVAEHIRIYDGVQSLALSGTAQAITPATNATHAAIYAEGATSNDYARYWEHATAPTASVGKKLKDHEEIACADLTSFRAINGSGTVTLRIAYYHYA